jgi:hypothetical protein
LLLRGYWKEGLAGFIYASLLAVYSFLSEAKLLELSKSASEPAAD